LFRLRLLHLRLFRRRLLLFRLRRRDGLFGLGRLFFLLRRYLLRLGRRLVLRLRGLRRFIGRRGVLLRRLVRLVFAGIFGRGLFVFGRLLLLALLLVLGGGRLLFVPRLGFGRVRLSLLFGFSRRRGDLMGRHRLRLA